MDAVFYHTFDEPAGSVDADKSRAAEINKALVMAGVMVSEIAPHSEDLETYYLKLTGGANNG